MDRFTKQQLRLEIPSISPFRLFTLALLSLVGTVGCGTSRMQTQPALAVPPLHENTSETVSFNWSSQIAIAINYQKPADAQIQPEIASPPPPPSFFASCHEEELVGLAPCVMPEPILLEDPFIDGNCGESAHSWCAPENEEEYLSSLSQPQTPAENTAIVPNFMPPVDNAMMLRGMQSPKKRKKRGHYGVDLIPAAFSRLGVPIRAIEDGVVMISAHARGYGYYIVLYHQNGLFSLYSHVLERDRVKAGEQIERGDVLAYMGKTGNARGYHLHFELIDLREVWNLKENIDDFAAKVAAGASLSMCEQGQFNKLLFARASKIDPVEYIPMIASAARVNGKWAALTEEFLVPSLKTETKKSKTKQSVSKKSKSKKSDSKKSTSKKSASKKSASKKSASKKSASKKSTQKKSASKKSASLQTKKRK